MSIHWSSIDADRPLWLGGGQWMLRDLQDITIVFGKNGGGKSLLLRDINEKGRYSFTHYSSPERSGDIVYDQAISQQELDPMNRGANRKGRNWAQQYRRETVSRIGALMTKLGAAAGKRQPIPKGIDFGKIESEIRDLLPNFNFEVVEAHPFFQLDRVNMETGESTRVGNPANELSSGEAEALTLALDLLTIANIWEIEGREQRLILIDEPDPHLHPDLQVRFASFLSKLVEQFGLQLLVATHSTTFLAAVSRMSTVSVGVIYLNPSSYEQPAKRASESLRRLSTVLGGHALIGPLFGAPLLLVEGDDDYAIWSHVPRQPGYRDLFAVLPCGGDEIFEHHDMLELLFSSIRDPGPEPAGFALLDGDKSIPTHSKREHIKYLRLQCHEAENLYLTDQVLGSLRLTWSDAQEKIRVSASDYGEKADALRALVDADRQAADLKGLMGPLCQILDEKNVAWTIRVGQAIGRQKPRGELAEFLGEDLVASLWS